MKISTVVEFMFWFIIDKVWKDIKIFTIVYVYPYAVPGTSMGRPNNWKYVKIFTAVELLPGKIEKNDWKEFKEFVWM